MELRVKLEEENLPFSSSIDSGLKQGDSSSPLLFNFVLEYAIKKVEETNLGLDINGLRGCQFNRPCYQKFIFSWF